MAAKPLKAVGVFGGTFDPVHLGHIQMVLEAKKRLDLQEIRLIPCRFPPHREQPRLNSAGRLRLLQLAVSGIEGVVVDERELLREGPSWTVDTLHSLRNEMGAEGNEGVSLVLIVGADAYASLNTWKRWRELPTLVNIAVLNRPGHPLPKTGVLADWLRKASPEEIHRQPAGLVVALDQVQMDISGTGIRRQLAAGELPTGLAPAVRDYIVEHRLYGFSKAGNITRDG